MPTTTTVKTACPHCSKSFTNVALHITKAHDSWLVEKITTKVWGVIRCPTTKRKIPGWEVSHHWVLTKNGETAATFTSAWGDTTRGVCDPKDTTRYTDWHAGQDCPYILLLDEDGDHMKTKIVYAHYKAHSTGLSKASTIVCDTLTVIS